MTKPMTPDEQIDEILDRIVIRVSNETHPPYTEDNLPRQLLQIKGKDEAKAELKQLIQSERLKAVKPYRSVIEIVRDTMREEGVMMKTADNLDDCLRQLDDAA